jgi:NAD(P)-dependent dehydrogenase (short-subunit alcohol dehydrogenase family)
MKKKLKPLSKQTIVVVGASSGMGRATALEAARRGARVVVAARNAAALESLVQKIVSEGGEAESVVADVSDYDQVANIAERARERFGGFDTWAHFSATAIYSSFSDLQPDEFKRVIDVNLTGQAYGAMVALRHLRHKGRGALIFISSVEGEVSMPFHSAYAASKHGVDGMFDAIRLELAHAHSPVSVTLVKPTGVNTPFFTNARTKIGVKPRPPKPIYQPEHVADAVLFAAEHPVRELFVGGAAKAMVMSKRLFPRLMDLYLLGAGFSAQRSRQPKSGDAPTNMFTSETGDERIHGDYTQQSKSYSCYTWLETHPAACTLLKAVGLMIGIGWLSERLDAWDRSKLMSNAERSLRRAKRRWN